MRNWLTQTSMRSQSSTFRLRSEWLSQSPPDSEPTSRTGKSRGGLCKPNQCVFNGTAAAIDLQSGVACCSSLRLPLKLGVAPRSSQALARLRAHEYGAVLIDQAFLETEPVESDMVLENMGTAVPVHVNFAINNMDRVARELRTALLRHKKQVQLV